MNPKITSINIRTDGEPVAICLRDCEGRIDYNKISLIAFEIRQPEKTYQLSCLGVQPYSCQELVRPDYRELEVAVDELINGGRKTGKLTFINRGVPRVVCSNENYCGILSLGDRFEKLTRAGPEYRELVEASVIGSLVLNRYSPEAKPEFDIMKKYLETRRIEAKQEKRRRRSQRFSGRAA
jgi:hypothetical protein